jgi:hypothetical protein
MESKEVKKMEKQTSRKIKTNKQFQRYKNGEIVY